MRFASGISDSVQLVKAAGEVSRQIREQLAGAPCHAVFVFASPIYRAHWNEALALLHERLRPQALIGCSGSGVIGGEQECEWVPALAVVAAHWPGVRLHPFALDAEALQRASAGGFWMDTIGAFPTEQPSFVLLADPYTCDPAKLLEELNATFPGRPCVGGLVSGGTSAGEQRLFCHADMRREGVVGLAITGNVQMDVLVSQSCRPIGRPVIVTKSEGNIVWELGGQQAMDILREALMSLTLSEQELAQRSIFAGLVINEMKSRFQAGDFLIRELVGIDPPSGAIALAEDVQLGQTLQFHLRDPGISRQQLRQLLAAHRSHPQQPPPAGGLVFNCLGRGKAFYGVPNQDLRTIRTFSGNVPVGGFFCNGEIGPVGGLNLLHGYTASVGLFRPAAPPRSES